MEFEIFSWLSPKCPNLPVQIRVRFKGSRRAFSRETKTLGGCQDVTVSSDICVGRGNIGRLLPRNAEGHKNAIQMKSVAYCGGRISHCDYIFALMKKNSDAAFLQFSSVLRALADKFFSCFNPKSCWTKSASLLFVTPFFSGTSNMFFRADVSCFLLVKVSKRNPKCALTDATEIRLNDKVCFFWFPSSLSCSFLRSIPTISLCNSYFNAQHFKIASHNISNSPNVIFSAENHSNATEVWRMRGFNELTANSFVRSEA